MNYQKFLEELDLYMALLDDAELARLAAVLSTAETRTLARMAERYPEEYVSN